MKNLSRTIIKGFPNKTQTGFKRITHRSTGRQKQARFLPIELAIYWLKNVLISKENPFSLLPPVSLNVSEINSIWETN